MPPLRPLLRFRPIARPISTGATATSNPTPSTPPTSPFAPRHLLSIADLSPTELITLIRNAAAHKKRLKSGQPLPSPLNNSLTGKTVALLFSKLSSRTRISTEGAVAALGGHPMFLGRNDIQLGVNESLYDTSVMMSSMVSSVVARVDAHADIAALAKNSSVPVINALCDQFHPMQTLADYLTIVEAFTTTDALAKDIGLSGLKIAWVGDANNVLYDLCIASVKMGVTVNVATPRGYGIPEHMQTIIDSARQGAPSPGTINSTYEPLEAVKNADIIVTDTWVSMGQEAEKAKRLNDFRGFQVTKEMAERGGAKEGWKFMHCLPRHSEEVSDEVFYSQRSLVFQEAENRLWSAMAAVEGFVVNQGKIAATS
ncbi:MAG: hypothetical protein Q9160_008015 [Pyrenula sp. 1 TL-2023]